MGSTFNSATPTCTLLKPSRVQQQIYLLLFSAKWKLKPGGLQLFFFNFSPQVFHILQALPLPPNVTPVDDASLVAIDPRRAWKPRAVTVAIPATSLVSLGPEGEPRAQSVWALYFFHPPAEGSPRGFVVVAHMCFLVWGEGEGK